MTTAPEVDTSPATSSSDLPEHPRRRPTRRAVLLGIGGLGLGLAGGAAWALDRFVLEHVEISDTSSYEAEQQGTAGTTLDTSDAELTSTGWSAGENSIEISTHTSGDGDDTVTAYVADVRLTDATLLRSAFAQNQFGENITEKTSDIAERNGAVLAVNGDYYGFRDTGIVVRNGAVYRDAPARDGLAIYRDGRFEIYDETATDAQSLVDDGVWHTLSFGPPIVEDGQVLQGIDDIEIDTNIGNHSIQGQHPRTAIGLVETNHLLLVVVDGREQGYSAGLTMTGLAELMVELGSRTAYNLDGGGSSTMVFGGEVVNQPSNNGERGVSDVLYVAG